MLVIINKLIHFLLFVFLLPIFTMCGEEKRPFRGRYTDKLDNYQLLVPHKIDVNGEFVTFNLPHFYEHDFNMRRRKRDYSSDPAVHYKLHFNGDDHHLELFPNYDFLAPEAITERHSPGSDISVSARQMNKINPVQCHYTGKIRGVLSSSAAVSCCDGLSGYVRLDDQVYLIEPAHEYGPNDDGHHLHIIHTHSNLDPRMRRNCGANNWQDGWREALNYRHKMDTCDQNVVKKAKTSSDSDIYYLELLVVADKKFLDFHRDKDYESYILTIMNMASNLYHDSSSGQRIELNVVRIIYMDKYAASLDLEITHEASKTLDSFCKWQQSVNPKELEHPQHHDIAVLLTRQDICEGDESDACQLLGLAYVGLACNPSKSCAINEDSGLVLGVVVAHEIGHILGADHDTLEDSGCKEEAGENTYYVMSPLIRMSSYTWSKCTRKYYRELFENGLGDCLMDEPAESAYKYSEMLPGSVYDADYQCHFFSANSTVCPIDGDKLCQKLFCRVANNKCRSYGDPPADGTKCGHDSWCYRRECVPIGKRPNSEPGGWSNWGNWSDCSRTCGGGIQFSERECDNPPPKNGGLYCQGEHKKYRVCNTKSCGLRVKSFRATQCSKFDNKPFAGKFYTWLPYTPAKSITENTCVLYCKRVKGSFSKLSPRADDGTPCKKGTYNMCVSGSCHKVGCDWKLDSRAIEDNCGVCNGDGNDCEQITGEFSDSGTEYTRAIKIPKGARKIEIVEVEPSINFIALKNDDDQFVLNNDPTKEEPDGEKDFDGNLGLYEHVEPKKEYLYMPGPTNQGLKLYIYFNHDHNVGYKYSYYVYTPQEKRGTGSRKEEEIDNDEPEYHWENVDWTECSARCDGGEAKSLSKCISNSGGGEVNDQFCLKLVPKPEPMTRVCNKHECKIFWHTGDWAPCSGCKHHPGAQFRSVWCAKHSPRWEEADILTSDDDCIDVDGPKPSNKQLCVDKCNKVNCRRGRSASKYPTIEIDDTDIYNYKFFAKLYRKINKEMKLPSEEIIGLNWIDDESKEEPIIDEPLTTIMTETITSTTAESVTAIRDPYDPESETLPSDSNDPETGFETETPPTDSTDSEIEIPSESTDAVTETQFSNSNDADTETQLYTVQNPDIAKASKSEKENDKCPVRSILDSLGSHTMGTKHMMFLFPKRRLGRQNIKRAREAESKTQKPPLIVLKDRVPEKTIKIEEAKIKVPNTDFLSDYAYRKLGDKVTGSIDLDHKKIWIGPKAIVKIEKEQTQQRKETNI